MIASFAVGLGGCWAYDRSLQRMSQRLAFVGELKSVRSFFRSYLFDMLISLASRVHETILMFVAALVAGTCLYLLAVDDSR